MTEEASKLLNIDPAAETTRICGLMRTSVSRSLRRQGAVVALSGGIDSSVTAALAATAFGAERVVGLLMPERDSASDTLRLSTSVAETYRIRTEYECITSVLESLGCYERQDEAYRRAVPAYGPGWKAKIVLPAVTEQPRLRYFSLIARSPEGEEVRTRLSATTYLQLVAATNFKQRVRKMYEYYYADRYNYAVCGTPNRLEYDQGFFVKLGDGAADLKPIAHLYKTQVYQLAEYLGVPREVRRRPPTSDTYSLPQCQDEFFFSLPYDQMDLCLYGVDHGLSPSLVARLIGLTPARVERIYADIHQKRTTGTYLHSAAILFNEKE